MAWPLVQRLTAYLEARKMADMPAHPDFAHVAKPAGLTVVGKPACRACPRSAEHPSYYKGRLAQALAANHRLSLKTLRNLPWLVQRLARDTRVIEGSQPGYLINAGYAYNAADFLAWDIVSVSGRFLTLRTQDTAIDPRRMGLYAFRFDEPEFGLYDISGGIAGVIQGGDEIEFLYPSCLELKNRPTVVRVTACVPAARTVTVELDQDVGAAMWPSSIVPTGQVYSVKSWRAAGDREKWQPVRDPDWFRGKTVRRGWESADLNAAPFAGGVVPLTGPDDLDTAVAAWHHRVPAVPNPTVETPLPHATFVVEGFIEATGVWADISEYAWVRTRIETIPGPPITYRTRLYLGATRWDGAPITDLRPTYSRFRATYVALLKPTGQAPPAPGVVAGHCRCRWSQVDHTKSVGNWAAPNGVGVDPATGKHHFCALRRYPVLVPVYQWVVLPGLGSPDPVYIQTGVDVQWRQPTGIANFPADGRCLQHNACDKNTPAEATAPGGHDGESMPFVPAVDFGRWWKGITAAVGWRIRQGLPGIASYRNLTWQRVAHESLRSLHGGYDLATPPGIHEQTWFPAWGGFGLGEVETYSYTEVVDGVTLSHTRLRLKRRGAHVDASKDLSTVVAATPGTYPGPGHYPGVLGADYTTKHREIAYTTSIPSGLAATDPGCTQRLFDARSAYHNVMDDGTIGGRGLPRYTHATPAPVMVYVEAADLVDDAFLDVDQDRGDALFRRFSEYPTILGTAMGGVIRIRPLTNPEKQPAAGVSGTVAAVTELGDGRYLLEIENGEHAHGIPGGPAGNRVDVVKRWKAGGTFVRPPEWQRIPNYYEPNKTLGSQGDLCMPGDCVGLALSAGGVDFGPIRFLVTEAAAHAGTMDTDWGNDYRVRIFEPAGYWEAPAAATTLGYNTILGQDIHGSIAASPITVATGVDASTTTIVIAGRSPVGAGAHYVVVRTSEQVIVTGVTNLDGTGPWSITVTRPINGTTAAPIIAGDVLFPVVVAKSDDTLPVSQQVAQRRPRQVDAGKYWFDRALNRIYFAPAQVGLAYKVHCYVAGKLPFSAAWIEGTGTVPSYATWESGFPLSDAARPISLRFTLAADAWGGSQVLTYTAGLPGPGQYAMLPSSTAAGTILFAFSLQDAGRPMRIDVDLGVTGSDPGEVARTPGYATWGRKRDTITVVDDGGFVAAAGASALVGAGVTQYMSTGVWVPQTGGKLQVAAYATDTWEDVAGAVAEHGRGLWHVPHAAVLDVRSRLGALVCFRFATTYLDHSARPAAELINQVIDQVQCSNEVLAPVGGGPGAPFILKHMIASAGFLPSSWGVRCSAITYTGVESKGYRLRAGEAKVGGVQHGLENTVFNSAWSQRSRSPEYVDGYGLIDYSTVAAGDMIKGGAGNTLGFVAGYYGTTDPGTTPVVFPFYHGPTNSAGVPENWISTGRHVDKGCPAAEAAGEFSNYHTDFHEVSIAGGGIGVVGSGPGVDGVVQNAVIVSDYPRVEWIGYDLLISPLNNYIGGIVPGGGDDAQFVAEAPEARFQCSGGGVFNHSRVLQCIPDGSTILLATVELRIDDLRTISGSTKTTLNPATRLLVPVHTSSETRNSAGIALIAGQVTTPTTGTFAWDVLAGVNATLNSDEWGVADVTAIVQSMISTYRGSDKRTRFALVPTPYLPGITGATSTEGLLRALMPAVTWANSVHPDNATGWKDANLDAAKADRDWASQVSGSYVTWSGLAVGLLRIRFRYPNSEEERVVVIENRPPTD